ncbi:N-acetylglucosamine-6-phosphate deacetylase [Paenibacillus alkalitolerans]|uniref:N-acetylglucosamine-6-phosphate deacetylase n=1 Tax=Paenibacillus alkalitolerans TaxID=2799335 RepID=UPI003899006E
MSGIRAEKWAVRANIVTPEGVLHGGTVIVSGGTIAEVLAPEQPAPSDCPVIDAGDGWLVPGFIDVHVHGGYGYDFMNATKEAFDAITQFHGRHGTTGMLATTVTASKDDVERVLAAADKYVKDADAPYASLYGVHLEGPFISPKFPGAQNPQHIVPPNQEWIKEWTERFPGVVKMMTLAPETEGALEVIELASSSGIVCACGHTNASYDEMIAAADKGLKHAVHTFNAMKGLHHREPGTVGAVLTEERISAEVIADGHHVHPACIKLLTQAKRSGNLLLITDAMSAAGLGDGDYALGGLDVTVLSGVARLTNGGSLAGSTLTMIDAFRFMVYRIGLSISETSRLASANPAKLLGLDTVTGSVAAGKTADLVLLTPDLRILGVWRNGNAIHHQIG